MRKQVFLMILILIFLTSVLALEPLVVEIKSTDNLVLAGTETTLEITIKNNKIRDEIIDIIPNKINTFPISEVFDYIIAEPSQLTLKSNREAKILLKIKTLPSVPKEGRYDHYLTIKSLTDPSLEIDQIISIPIILPEKTVSITPEIESQIVPNKETRYQLIVKNRANLDLTESKIKIESDFYNHEFDIDLIGENSASIFDLNLLAASTIQEGTYPLTFTALKNEKIIGTTTIPITLTLSPDLEEEQRTESGFLSNTVKITKRNKGNSVISKLIKYPVKPQQKFFTTTNPKAEIINENGRDYYIWNINLKPNEVYNLEIITDYKAVFTLILLVLLLIGLYSYSINKNVVITKKVLRIKLGKEGSTNLKILILLNNRTLKDIHNIKLRDFVPQSVKLNEEFSTLNPSKLERTETGTKITWEIPLLEPGEERIISYQIEAKLASLDKLPLHSAIVEYRHNNKRLVHNASNKVTIYSPKQDK